MKSRIMLFLKETVVENIFASDGTYLQSYHYSFILLASEHILRKEKYKTAITTTRGMKTTITTTTTKI